MGQSVRWPRLRSTAGRPATPSPPARAAPAAWARSTRNCPWLLAAVAASADCGPRGLGPTCATASPLPSEAPLSAVTSKGPAAVAASRGRAHSRCRAADERTRRPPHRSTTARRARLWRGRQGVCKALPFRYFRHLNPGHGSASLSSLCPARSARVARGRPPRRARARSPREKRSAQRSARRHGRKGGVGWGARAGRSMRGGANAAGRGRYHANACDA
mmetsp:Transcript_8541/g.25876  ORF Transcript_8541/g.25876 Transcript_8541/m.25876 type:complete len:218 (+) Transcript_8541:2912-3565(+)